VLVVEDDRTARRAVTQILKRQGYTVSEAGTVAEAVELLARRPDWVLLDLMLPDGCGTEVLRRAREAGGSRVCVVTGCGPNRIAAARALAPEALLCKPLDVGRMLSLLEV
jgi:DNA-binding response OmpR family regulator